MQLVTFVLGLPLAPVRGLVRVTEILRDQAEQELHGTASARAELEAIAERRRAGEISEEEEAAAMDAVSRRLVARPEGGS